MDEAAVGNCYLEARMDFNEDRNDRVTLHKKYLPLHNFLFPSKRLEISMEIDLRSVIDFEACEC